MFYRLAFCVFMFLFKVFFHFSIWGKENIPSSNSVILAANHSSYLDPIVVGLTVYPRKVSFMAKEELFHVPILSFLIKHLYAFPVKRGELDRRAMRTALELLSKGRLLGLFPEGTRVREQKLGEAKAGAALLSLKSKKPLVPLAIMGTDKVLPPGKVFPRFPKIRVVVGKPMGPLDFKDSKDRDKKEVLLTFTKEMMHALAEMLDNNNNEMR